VSVVHSGAQYRQAARGCKGICEKNFSAAPAL